jgi:GTP pyrophosphokinase
LRTSCTPTSATSAWRRSSTARWRPCARLQNGDIVQITTQPGHKPSRDWLSFAVTSRARSKIKHVLQAEERSRSIEFGKRLFEKEARRFDLNPKTLLESPEMLAFAVEYGAQKPEDLLAYVGYGKLAPRSMVQKAVPGGLLRERAPDSAMVSAVKRVLRTGAVSDKIKVKGADDIMVFLARCCNPIRGERIVGYITRGKGVSVHAATCRNVVNLMFAPSVASRWNGTAGRPGALCGEADVRVEDRKGMLAEIS